MGQILPRSAVKLCVVRRGQRFDDRAIRLLEREGHDIHGIGKEIAVGVGQADHRRAAGADRAARTRGRYLATVAAGGEGAQAQSSVCFT